MAFAKMKDNITNYANEMLQNINNDLLWRLVVNAHEHQEGWHKFEQRQPGTLTGFTNAFHTMLAEVSLPITEEQIRRYHRICMNHIKSTESTFIPGEYRLPTFFSSTPAPASLTRPFLCEFLANSRLGKEEDFIISVQDPEILAFAPQDIIYTDHHKLQHKYYDRLVHAIIENSNQAQSHLFIYSGNVRPNITAMQIETMVNTINTIAIHRLPYEVAEIKQKINTTIQNFHDQCADMPHPSAIRLQSDLALLQQSPRLRAIITCIRSLAFLHPFIDGNGRVFVNLLLNKLLMQNFMPPVMLNNAEFFFAFTVDQLQDEVLLGMERFLFVSAKGN